MNVRAIATATARLDALMFGAEDLASDSEEQVTAALEAMVELGDSLKRMAYSEKCPLLVSTLQENTEGPDYAEFEKTYSRALEAIRVRKTRHMPMPSRGNRNFDTCAC